MANQKRKKKPSLLVNAVLALGALSVLGLLVGVPLLLMRDKAEDTPAPLKLPPPPPPVQAVTETPEPTPPAITQTPTDPPPTPAKEEAPTPMVESTPPVVTPIPATPPPPPAATMTATPTPAETPPPSPPLPSAEPTMATVSPDSPPEASKPAEPAAPSAWVQDEAELERFKENVFARISAARDQDYPPEMKEVARETLRRVKGLFKIGTLVFVKPGSVELDAAMEASLLAMLQQPDIVKWSNEPEARIISLGFADPTGTPDANAVLSRERAVTVNDFINGELPSIRTYGFGIGATTVVDSDNQENNRAVEIWLAVGQGAGGS